MHKMDKLDMQTRNIADKNYVALTKLFPNALTEKIVGYDEEGKAMANDSVATNFEQIFATYSPQTVRKVL